MKNIIFIFLLFLSVNGYTQKADQSYGDQILKEYNDSWKYRSVTEKGDSIIFFISESGKYGVFLKYAEEFVINGYWKKSRKKIVFKEGDNKKIERLIKSWTDEIIVLFSEEQPELEIIYKK